MLVSGKRLSIQFNIIKLKEPPKFHAKAMITFVFFLLFVILLITTILLIILTMYLCWFAIILKLIVIILITVPMRNVVCVAKAQIATRRNSILYMFQSSPFISSEDNAVTWHS